MKQRMMAVLFGTMTAIAPTTALANDKADFEACDGLVHPGKQADGMRGPASTSAYAIQSDLAIGTVDSCTRALASPRLLPTQTVRRANLLRARGAAQLRAGDTAAALKDFDLAEGALGAAGNDPFLKRSIGVSLSLLRAIAHARAGDATDSVALARGAAAMRPYSLQVQRVAAEIVQTSRSAGDKAATPWLALGRLDPAIGTTALIKEAEIGDFASVVALRPTVDAAWPEKPVTSLSFVVRDPDATKMMTATIVSLHTAYARAATGDVAGARRDLADVRTHVAGLIAKIDTAAAAGATDKQPASAALAPMAAALTDGFSKYVDVHARQIEARIAVADGRPSEAVAALIAAPMPHDAATVDLLGALKRAMPAKDLGVLPDIAPFETESAAARQENLTAIVPLAMIAPETPRAVIDYSRARPNILAALVGGALSMGTSLLGGISRTDGFRSTVNPDQTVKVEFTGNTTSDALVQEMTLLRAAEVARAAGKPAFVITERQDYTRRLVMTQYGRQISSTPTGFKSELTIRPVAAGEDAPHALDAVAIIDALGPLYYEDKKPA